MSIIESKLEKLGYQLPTAKPPLFSYVPIVQYENLLFISGQLPRVDGTLKWKGKVGKDFTIEQAQEISRICIINSLSQIKQFTNNLDVIEKVVQLRGFVNSYSRFNQQPRVIDGASNLLEELLGEKGKHSRTAIGVSELPQDSPVEIELIVQIKESGD